MATVVVEKDAGSGIARVTLNNPDRKNAYDPAMRRLLDEAFDDIANDDSMKVLLLRGAGGVFCTGADMANAYSWYDGESDGEGDGGRKRRPSQRRRLAVDRNTFSFYHRYLGYPKATVAQVEGYALGGGLELALMSDISVVASDTKIGMPAARFLGPALGTLHLFFYRLGPVLTRRLLLTGDTVAASEVSPFGVFTDVVEQANVASRAEHWARKVAKMPADGIAIAKEAYRLVEQLQAYQGEEVASYLFHAYATNLQFDDDEFNFVKVRAAKGTKEAFKLRDRHFDVSE